MTDTTTFVRQAELELRSTRTISRTTCQAWEDLSGEARTAFARAMTFLGCQPSGTGAAPSRTAFECDRVAAARLMLVKLGAATDDPRWSSDVLDNLLRAVMEAPDGSVGDLLIALFGVLGDYSPDLSNPLAAFIKDLVVKCFTRYRRSYDLVNWKGVIARFADRANNAQLYLALQAIPPQFVPPQLADTIAKGLESTPFRDEAVSTLGV